MIHQGSPHVVVMDIGTELKKTVVQEFQSKRTIERFHSMLMEF